MTREELESEVRLLRETIRTIHRLSVGSNPAITPQLHAVSIVVEQRHPELARSQIVPTAGH